VLGHSLGAMVGWQLVNRLESSGRRVAGFIPMGCPPPHAVSPESARLRNLVGDELLAYLRSIDGLPADALEEPELLSMALTAVSADFRITADYPAERIERRLTCPVLAVGGRSDHSCPPDLVRRWADSTTAGADIREIDGGHFFLTEHPAAVARLVGEFCAQHRTAS
jgi:pyochelin biosynthetic protein PchC